MSEEQNDTQHPPTVEGEFVEGENTPDVESVDAQSLLNYSQRIRRQAAHQLTQGGIPTDKDQFNMLLNVLRDMDHTSVQRSKLDIDRESLTNDRQAQEIVKQIYQSGGRSLLRSEEPVHRGSLEPDELPEYEPVRGETQIGVVEEDTQSFFNRMDGTNEGSESQS